MPHRPSPIRRAPNRRTAGFTLAELLVAVAIVAVLVAIAVPVFTGALGDTEEAACAANRRSLKSAYTTAWLLDQKPGTEQKLFDECFAKLKEQNAKPGEAQTGNPLCPSDGNYRASFNKKTGAVSIVCLVHGASDEDKVNDWITNNAWNGGSDSTYRDAYAEANGLDAWPEVKGVDDEPVYLSFKTYGNSSDTAYLYAGKAQSVSDGNPWRANYLCDSTGEIFGTPGQWYRLPQEMNLGISPDQSGAALRNKLSEAFGADYADTLQKVVLDNGAFKPV